MPFDSGREVDVVVVGAGMAGLVAARDLADQGTSVLVVDKGRGVGGRMATRRFDGAVFDHGAQFFTARTPRFRRRVAEWTDAGRVAVWFEGPLGARLRGVPAMTSVCKSLAADLEVRTGTRVRSVSDEGVLLDDGAFLRSRATIVTAPLPQAVELLDGIDVPAGLRSLEYDACLALMLVTDADLTGGRDAVAPDAEEPVMWISDNVRKGISQVGAFTVHAGPAFSTAHGSAGDEAVCEELLSHLGLAADSVAAWQLKRWRYSRPRTVAPRKCEVVATGPSTVVLAGDAFGGPRVEGAATSGRVAAQVVSRLLSRN